MLLQTTAETITSSPTLFGALIPLLVSQLTKQNLDPRFKALLAAVFAFGVALFNSKGVVDQASIEQALHGVFSALAAYKGIWEHLSVNAWFPNLGIGPRPVYDLEPGDPGYVEGD